MSKTKILVTGSGGFIMSNFIRQTLKSTNNFSIVSVDSCTNGKAINTIYSNKSNSFYIANVCDNRTLRTIFEIERPDIVINGASSNNSLRKELIETEVIGTQNLIDLCQNFSIKKLISLSSYQVYEDHVQKNKEQDKLFANNIFSSGKLCSETLLRSQNSVKYNILRLSDVYGPRQSGDNFIPDTINNLILGEPVFLDNKGENIKQYIHVQNVCSAIQLVIDNWIDNQIYNVTGTEANELDACSLISSSLNLFEKPVNKDLISLESGSSFDLLADSSKIKNLGWNPSFKLKDGINHTVQWYLSNSWFLK